MDNYFSASFLKHCENDPELLVTTKLFEDSKPERIAFQVTTKPQLLGISSEGIEVTNMPSPGDVHRMCIRAKEYGNVQAYSRAIEKWIGESFDFEFVSPSECLGDFRHPLLGECETKVSLSREGSFSVKQVRTARPIPYYNLMMWSPGYLFFGFVPEDVMKRHVGGQCHGTRESSKDNKDPELCLKNPTFKKGRMNAVLADLERYNYYGGGAHLVK